MNRKSLLLRESFEESRGMLAEAVKGQAGAGSRQPYWDAVVVTTSTERQAEVCREMLARRVKEGCLPAQCEYLVIPDEGGKRIGSGGSTLRALVRLYRDCGQDMARLVKKRVLVLHSGGDAKRMPHAAPLGKLFALSGRHVWDKEECPAGTVFDDLAASMAGLPSRMRGGVVVVSADAYFRFNHTQADLDTPDAVAFAMKAPVKEGTVHGVFKADDEGRVQQFLHKLPETELRALGAVSKADNVDLDIGLAYLGEGAVKALLGLVTLPGGAVNSDKLNLFGGAEARLSFYGDFLYAMAGNSTLESYLPQPAEGDFTDELMAARPEVFARLRGVKLYVARLSPGELHSVGTTEEAVKWAQSLPNSGAELCAALVRDTRGADVAEGALVENSRLSNGAKVGRGCLISGCDAGVGFEIPDGIAVQALPVQGGWVARVWGNSDDPKSPNSWLNRPFDIAQWDAGAASLWEAKLYPVCETHAEALGWAVRLAKGLSQEEKGEWRGLRRLSLADGPETDVARHLRRRDDLEDDVRRELFAQALLWGRPFDEALPSLGLGEKAQKRIERLAALLREGAFPNWSHAMRLWAGIAEAAERLNLPLDAGALREQSFTVLRNAAVAHAAAPEAGASRWECERVETSFPVRVNLAGSWTDAPPYCFEKGGTLINAAVVMDGRAPITVTAERLTEPRAEFISLDLRAEAGFTELSNILSYQDPTDTYMLFKAALVASGAVTAEGGPLPKQLERLGGGIRITTQVSVPKGSGLGTSSILTGALIDAVTRLMGRPRDALRLSADVLLAEQLMTTGGGWQDAIGGMIPGIKLTHTEPGIPQIYDVRPVELSPAALGEFNSRAFLLYTGQRRLAKSVLRRVLTAYMLNSPESLSAFSEIRRLSPVMAHELRLGDISAFGSLLTHHMALLRRLDASSSNLMLDHLVAELADLATGVSICGAGGGGFLFGILKPGTSIADLQRWAAASYEDSLITPYSAELFTGG